jgi:hypothetical protein
MAALGLAAGCSASVPKPPPGTHPTSALTEVKYPPPAARVETLPAQPKDGTVWVDGQWVWRARRWVWEPGGWVMPPPGARYARSVSVRRGDGTLWFAAGLWRGKDGEPIPPPPVLAPPQDEQPASRGGPPMECTPLGEPPQEGIPCCTPEAK